ncbi:MAG: cell division protein SepF [Candidatus Diapherotrites archaeon]
MALLNKVFKKEEFDIEEFLNSLDVEEETMYEDVDAFVKPMVLSEEADVDKVMKEVKSGNIILLNVEALTKRNVLKVKEYVNRLKAFVNEIDGDIARISHDRIIITPSKVKIIKKKIKE